MNNRFFALSILALTMQIHAAPSIRLVNNNTHDSRLSDLIVTYNDTVVKLRPGEGVTIPTTAQNFNVLRALTNIMVTDKYYKFHVTHISDEPAAKNQVLEIGSHSLLAFDKETYSVTLDEHNALQVKRDAELVRFN